MARVNLCLRTLGDLDGGAAGLVVDKAIAAAVADLDDRGRDGQPRKVVITLELLQNEDEMVVAHVEAKITVPVYKTRNTIAKVASKFGQQQLVFQQHDPTNPDQETLPIIEGEVE